MPVPDAEIRTINGPGDKAERSTLTVVSPFKLTELLLVCAFSCINVTTAVILGIPAVGVITTLAELLLAEAVARRGTWRV
tara:strand:+ start:369 stop:608 length:240 start_codon:yes stop_codon:yes gene_type:complete